MYVTDAGNNPIDAAQVSIDGPVKDSGNTLTDAKGKGHHLFAGLVAGQYSITVTKKCGLSIRATSSSPSMTFQKDSESVTAGGSGSANAPAGQTTPVTIQFPALSVTELGFDGSFPIKEWTTKNDVTDPRWKLSGNPDKPACYKMESAAMKLNPTVAMGGPATPTSTVPLTSGQLTKQVQLTKLSLDWSYSLDGGAFLSANTTGPHKIYQVFDTPKESPLFDLALDKSCGKCSGESAIDDIAPKINSGIKADLTYAPSLDVRGSAPLVIYSKGKCQCINNADLLVYLARSCGIDAVVVWIWAGTGATQVTYYHLGSFPAFTPCFRVLAPKNGDAAQDPHFTFHAEVNINSKIYDPSYGNVGLINLNETAPGCSRQTGASMGSLTATTVPWNCLH